jgi:large subunit ribosomal protein L18
LRKKIIGTLEKPRLCVYRSLKHFSAQLVNDAGSKTIISLSTFDKAVKSSIKCGGNVLGAENLGRLFAQEASKKGIKKVVFDRGGRKYHGRVKAFAESCRKNGLDF